MRTPSGSTSSSTRCHTEPSATRLDQSAPSAELDTVTTARQRAETSLGDEAADVRRDLPSVLSEALTWAEADFSNER